MFKVIRLEKGVRIFKEHKGNMYTRDFNLENIRKYVPAHMTIPTYDDLYTVVQNLMNCIVKEEYSQAGVMTIDISYKIMNSDFEMTLQIPPASKVPEKIPIVTPTDIPEVKATTIHYNQNLKILHSKDIDYTELNRYYRSLCEDYHENDKHTARENINSYLESYQVDINDFFVPGAYEKDPDPDFVIPVWTYLFNHFKTHIPVKIIAQYDGYHNSVEDFWVLFAETHPAQRRITDICMFSYETDGKQYNSYKNILVEILFRRSKVPVPVLVFYTDT